MKYAILLAVSLAVTVSAQSFDLKRPPLIDWPDVKDRAPRAVPPNLIIVDTYPSDLVEHQNEQEQNEQTETPEKKPVEDVLQVIRLRREAVEPKPNENQPDVHGLPPPPSDLPFDRVRRSPKKGRGRTFVRGEVGRTGGKTDAAVHVGYEYRWKRSADEEDKEQVNRPDVHGLPPPPSDLPFERVRRSPKKGRGRPFVRGEVGRRGGKTDAAVHVGYEYRWRRSADEEDKEQVNLPDVQRVPEESRVKRSPKEPVRGRIVVSGNARRGASTRGRTEGQIYVGGQIRFRREANESEGTVPSVSQEIAKEATEKDVVSEEKDTLDLLGHPVFDRHQSSVKITGNEQ